MKQLRTVMRVTGYENVGRNTHRCTQINQVLWTAPHTIMQYVRNTQVLLHDFLGTAAEELL